MTILVVIVLFNNISDKNRRIVIYFIPIFLIINFFLSFKSEFSYDYFFNTKRWSDNMKKRIVKVVPRDGIILLKNSDKYLFPSRELAIMSAIPVSEQTEKLPQTIYNLIERGKKVYLLGERKIDESDLSEDDYLEIIKNNNLASKKILNAKESDYNLYEISKVK
jgi:hypothetical protein